MNKKKQFKKYLKFARSMLDDVPDQELSSVEGIQVTMNQFLVSQGLPPVSIPGAFGDVLSDIHETRTFDEVTDDLEHFGIDS